MLLFYDFIDAFEIVKYKRVMVSYFAFVNQKKLVFTLDILFTIRIYEKCRVILKLIFITSLILANLEAKDKAKKA